MDGTIREKIRRLRDARYAAEGEDFGELSDALTADGDFRALCLELAEEAVERELLADAIESRVKELQARKSRVAHSAETLRAVILQCMDVRGEKTITSPGLTLGVSARKPDVVVTDESLLPSRFFTPQPPKLDKAALRDAVLNDGEVIAGVATGNGKISLTIRRK
jgi:hypothetical protein